MSSLTPMSLPRTSIPSARTTRRRFLGYGSAGAAAVLLGTGAWDTDQASALPRSSSDPFTLGVASGDPRPDGVVLWTRLATDPFDPDGRGGMGKSNVRVDWEVARDPMFRRVVRRGSAVATRGLNHSVHPEVTGLEPYRPYWYRFRVGKHLSPVGRTKTAPSHDAMLSSMTYAFASCQAWHDGYFTAYDHMADEDLDFVVHLGDYLYEKGLKSNHRGVKLGSQFNPETFSLARYRIQYSLYKSEKPLQAAHAAFPWIQTIDDHEVENNWAGDISQVDTGSDQDPAVFRKRRARAFQAMYENMPLRQAQMPSGPDVRLHRRIAYGRLADVTMLDTRQYRDDQACGDRETASCTERFDPDRTMMGGKQKAWLLDGFSSSKARWQIIGNQAPMGQTDLDPSPKRTSVWTDAWDGYVAERNELLAEAQRRDVSNLMVITGDRHANYAVDLVPDHEDASSPVVGTEFVGTSISSGRNGAEIDDLGRQIVASNPHLKFYNGQRGYSRMTLTPTQCRNDFRVISYVDKPGAPVSTRASFVVEDGRPGVRVA